MKEKDAVMLRQAQHERSIKCAAHPSCPPLALSLSKPALNLSKGAGGGGLL